MVQSRAKTGLLQRQGQSGLSPQALMDGTTLFVICAAAGSMFLAPNGLMLPAFATVMMVAGGAVAVFAWYRGAPQQRALSIWDIAGSLLALGFCAAVLSDTASISALISL